MSPGSTADLRFAAQTAAALAVPVAIGFAVSNPSAGILASLGGFLAFFGADRPYFHRAVFLLVLGVGLAASVGIGVAVASDGWWAPVTVAAWCTFVTLAGNVFDMGHPGPYIFGFACASGSVSHSGHSALMSAAFVLLGAAGSWLMLMSGCLWHPRKPERDAVRRAESALRNELGAPDHASWGSAASRRTIAALDAAWVAVVDRQPQWKAVSPGLRPLREAVGALYSAKACTLMGEARNRCEADLREADRFLDARRVGSPAASDAWRRLYWRDLYATRTSGNTRLWLIGSRVAIATVAAGLVCRLLGFEHVYWAITVVVLVLQFGADRERMLVQALGRAAGTWAGLIVAGAVLALDPRGLYIAVAIAALSFCVGLVIGRNYLLGVVAVTGAALVTAAAGGTVPLSTLLLGRGLDTVLGLALAVAVDVLLIRPRPTQQLRAAERRVDVAITHLHSASGTDPADAARSSVVLTRALIELADLIDRHQRGSRSEHEVVRDDQPALLALQNSGYRAVANSWLARADTLRDAST